MQAKRFRGKINVQKPRKPHFERALFFEVARPILPFKYEDLKTFERCSNITSANRPVEPENPYVKLIAKEALNLFEKSKLVAFFHMNPVPIEQRFRLDRALKKQNMLMKTYGKKTLQAAFEGTPYKDAVLPFYVSHNMITFCAEPNIKTLMRITKKFPQFILLGEFINFIYMNKFVLYVCKYVYKRLGYSVRYSSRPNDLKGKIFILI